MSAAVVARLTRETYWPFVRGHQLVVVLFDAPAWDTMYEHWMRRHFQQAAEELSGVAMFGFVDTDGPDEADIVRSTPVCSLPLIAFYRDGNLVTQLAGNGRDLVGTAHAVLDGRI